MNFEERTQEMLDLHRQLFDVHKKMIDHLYVSVERNEKMLDDIAKIIRLTGERLDYIDNHISK